MPHWLGYLITAGFGYLMGSIPFGYVVVKLFKGKDIRNLGSGRTGGTNAYRAAGTLGFLLTGLGDIVKGVLAVWGAGWLAQQMSLGSPVVAQVLAGVMAVVGHNYSIFLSWRGGAGTGANVGVAAGLWFPALFILVPLVPIILVVTGYASVASLAIAGLIPILFVVRALVGQAPWEYAVYGILAGTLVVWALRPNIARLKAGKERLVGPRARAARKRQLLQQQLQQQQMQQDEGKA
jgi:glycerol-3-phosphate acyltransferase PlsY